MNVINWIFSSNEREVARFRKIAEKITALEPAMEALSDEQLRSKTDEFKRRLAEGETLDGILPEAFATVREAGKRTVGMRHFDVQLIGGMVLHEGRIAEMKTGEGKTLVATAPLYLNALEGKGAHLITVNDYLAKYHAQWMGPIYHFLGMSVGALQGSNPETGELEASYLYDPDYVNEEEPVYRNLRRAEKHDSYLADITYGTNHVFGFDYLRDNMAFSPEGLVQRELNYAIVDEVDSVLVDEARVPLILSGQAAESNQMYYKMDRVVARLMHERDYTMDEKAKTAMLTEEGMRRVEEGIGVENLSEDPDLMHYANAALKARTMYKSDIDYVVKGNGADRQVILVDEFTGRLMFGRRLSDGLHQAIEAKEGVKIEHESQTLAKITHQNYYRLYTKLGGMTGTAKTEEEEFRKIYGLDVVVIPTNQPMIRVDHPDVIYKTEESKLRGLTLEILKLHCKLQPVLVGTRSIETSERLSGRLEAERLQLLAATFVLRAMLEESKKIDGDSKKQANQFLNQKFGELTLGKLAPLARELGASLDMLKRENMERLAGMMELQDGEEMERLGECLAQGIEHNVLNAKYHEREAEIIADAGRLGAVTIATNMAGRGVDIILGGKPEGSTADRNVEAVEVVRRGGLAILGSERHESRRIDHQLRGRSGRQGDPGLSRFFVSLEDELWRVFGDRMQSPWLGSWPEEMAMDAKLLSRMIERTQKKMEAYHFGIRKQVLQYDDVMNVQREIIYGERRKILQGVDLKPTITSYLNQTVLDNINMHCPEGQNPAEWDTDTLFEMLDEIFPLSMYVNKSDLKDKKRFELDDMLTELAERAYEDREKHFGPELMRDLERQMALRAIDSKWLEHLDAMDYLLEGIGLRGYAQMDPLLAYKKEGFEMFDQMQHGIQDEIVRWMFRVQVQVVNEPYRNPYRNVSMNANEFTPPPTAGQGHDDPYADFEDGLPRPQRAVPVRTREKVGRNDPCPCGSGKKYKKCCLRDDDGD
ncbi:MAG: preprotein translocase subunit SecA [Armatimonadetes bacterium]|nr:preprotein translocase subunit SecA [Armatimonadota bacterium]